MEIKELTLQELINGYIKEKESGKRVCIFCGEIYEEGVIYQSRGRSVTAERAMKEHLADVHGGVFYGLIQLDKQVNGLSDMQKEVLTGMYQKKDNKRLGEALGISAATVRTHKFNLQKLKREARILLAVLEQIENEEIVAAREQVEDPAHMPICGRENDMAGLEPSMPFNRLHPFFTQYNLK